MMTMSTKTSRAIPIMATYSSSRAMIRSTKSTNNDDDHEYKDKHGHPYHGHVLVIQSHDTVDKVYKQ